MAKSKPKPPADSPAKKTKRKIEQYEHNDKTRSNNPPSAWSPRKPNPLNPAHRNVRTHFSEMGCPLIVKTAFIQ
jgi:hypothetical protein